MSDYSQGAQSAKALGEWFTAGDLMAGTVAVTSAKLTESVTTADEAGNTFVPTFVLFSQDLSPETAGAGYDVTTSATVVTFTRGTSAAADVIHYIIGNLE